jgi:hypothetical protein
MPAVSLLLLWSINSSFGRNHPCHRDFRHVSRTEAEVGMIDPTFTDQVLAPPINSQISLPSRPSGGDFLAMTQTRSFPRRLTFDLRRFRVPPVFLPRSQHSDRSAAILLPPSVRVHTEASLLSEIVSETEIISQEQAVLFMILSFQRI